MKNKENKIDIPKTNNPGVYAIINKTAGKCYIGQAQDINERLRNHICCLGKGKHPCKLMQIDYDKGHKFKMVALMEIEGKSTKDIRRCYEDYYIVCMRLYGIDLYNSERASKSVDNFFFRAKFLDKTVVNLKEDVISNRYP